MTASADDVSGLGSMLYVWLRVAWVARRTLVLIAFSWIVLRFAFSMEGCAPVLAGIGIGIALEFPLRWALGNHHRWEHGRKFFGAYWVVGGALYGLLFSIPLLFMAPSYFVPSIFSRRSTAENVIGITALIIGGIVGLWWKVLRHSKPKYDAKSGTWNTSHGTARWAELPDMENAGLLRGKGLLLGRTIARLESKLLTWDAPGHLLTVAPTRSGKGIGAVIPNLLVWPGSVLVNDPKGENYAVTARVRRSMGQKVIALDPFEVCGRSDCFNPLDLLDPTSLDIGDEAAVLADMLVIPASQDPFWDNNAKDYLKAIILYVACEAPTENRNLAHVRHLMMSGPEEWAATVQAMRDSTAAHGLLARLGNSISMMAEKTSQGILSSAKSHTGFLDSPRLGKVLSRSDFDMADLRSGDLSVYLILPPDKLDAYKSFLRLIIGGALQACIKAQARSSFPALFMLDEFAQLGPMDPVKRAYTLLGGYGVKVWAFIQDLGQLQHLYKEGSQTFIANAAVKQFFGMADYKTAEEVSKMLGKETITIQNFGSNSGTSESMGQHMSSGTSSGDNTGRSQTGRDLLTPDEVLRFNRNREIILFNSSLPIFADKLNYLTDQYFNGRFDHNPMHQTPASGPEAFEVGDIKCPYCHRLNLIGRPTCEGCGGALPKAKEIKSHER